jgi:hypothetical protein
MLVRRRRLSDTKQGLLVSLTLGVIILGFLLLVEPFV